MKKIVHILFAVAALLALPACTTTSTETKNAIVNAATVAAPSIETASRFAVPRILIKNPKLLPEFQAAATVASAIVAVAEPTAEGFATVLTASFPGIDPKDARDLGTLLEGAYSTAAAYITTQTGKTVTITSLIKDTQYQAAVDTLARALIRGVNEGIADYQLTL